MAFLMETSLLIYCYVNKLVILIKWFPFPLMGKFRRNPFLGISCDQGYGLIIGFDRF